MKKVSLLVPAFAAAVAVVGAVSSNAISKPFATTVFARNTSTGVVTNVSTLCSQTSKPQQCSIVVPSSTYHKTQADATNNVNAIPAFRR